MRGVGSHEMTAGIPVWSHGVGSCGTVQTPRPNATSSAQTPTLYTGLLGAGGFVHCGPRSEGTLYTWAGRHCTNPLRNDAPSAQSPRRRFRALYKPSSERTLQCANPRPSLPGTVLRHCPKRLVRPPWTYTLRRRASLFKWEYPSHANLSSVSSCGKETLCFPIPPRNNRETWPPYS